MQSILELNLKNYYQLESFDDVCFLVLQGPVVLYMAIILFIIPIHDLLNVHILKSIYKTSYQ